MSSAFRFKQFSVLHDQCQMKVGTDGVLLGAIADPSEAASILDIGTGSGLIALMMAQKCQAQITGIDIDKPSILQATENALNSPWSTRLEMIHATVQDFSRLRPSLYDMVISNPPFFSLSLKSPLPGRNRAKHDVELTFKELLGATFNLLRPMGCAWYIIPWNNQDEFIDLARECGFELASRTTVFPKQGKLPHRSILHLAKNKTTITIENELVIRNNDGTLTTEYKKICHPFYLD